MTTTQPLPQADSHPRIPVTLNCSGGISLGAYMAGVFYELTKEALKENGTIIIDIVTGASAGAITATLATYYLLGLDRLPDNAKESLFYKAWVDKVDIKFISGVSKGPEEDEETHKLNLSLLSGKAVKRISDELVGNFQEKFEQLIQDRISQSKKPTLGPLALLVTLTNLQGLLKKTDFPVSSEADQTDNEKIKTITSAETRQFLFHSGLLSSQEKLNNMWQKAELSCRASGAFPVAFPPVGDRSELESPNVEDLSEDYFINPEAPPKERILNAEKLKGIYLDDKHLQFQYTDGGVLDGLPIVRGVTFEKLLNEEGDEPSKYFGATDANLLAFREEWRQLKLNPDKRLYVYIQPTSAEDVRELPRLTRDTFSMLSVGISALTLPKEEHDAVRLDNVRQRNEDAKRKETLLKKLDEILNGLSDEQKNNFKGIKDRLKNEIDKAIPYRYIKLCRIDPSLVGKVYRDVKLSKFESIAKALEQNLTGYMKEAVENREIKRLLASDFLGAFGGFFNRRYREHDFLLGRVCGQIGLQENCWKIADESDPRIKDLEKLLQTGSTTFLNHDPKPSELIQSGQIRILENLIWRTLRILFVESRGKLEGTSDDEKALVFRLLGNVALKVIAAFLLALGIVFIAIALFIQQVLS